MLGPGGGKFRFLVVETALNEALAFGQAFKKTRLSLKGQFAGNALCNIGSGMLFFFVCHHSQPLRRRGQAMSTLEKQKVLDRAKCYFSTFILFYTHKAAF